MSPVKDRSPDHIGKYPLSIGPPVEVHSQPSPPSYPNCNGNVDGMEPNHSSSSLHITSSSGIYPYMVILFINRCVLSGHYSSDSYPHNYHSSSPPVRLSPQVSHSSHDPPPYPSSKQQHHMSSGDPHSYPTQESNHKQ